MGVDVILAHVEQPGSSPKRRRVSQMDVVLDNRDRFALICASSELPMLSRVDPYGTLILASQEMEQFIAELESESARAENSEINELLRGVIRVARECGGESSFELHIEGD